MIFTSDSPEHDTDTEALAVAVGKYMKTRYGIKTMVEKSEGGLWCVNPTTKYRSEKGDDCAEG